MKAHARKAILSIIWVHAALVVGVLAITWGLGLDFAAIWVSNVARLAVVLLPFSLGVAALTIWLTTKEFRAGLAALVVLGFTALFFVGPLWVVLVAWTIDDIGSGNGDRPDVSVDLGDGGRLVYFTTRDAGALGGANYDPAHVRSVFPGLERRDWQSPKELRDSTGWPVAIDLHGRTIPLPNEGGLRRDPPSEAAVQAKGVAAP